MKNLGPVALTGPIQYCLARSLLLGLLRLLGRLFGLLGSCRFLGHLIYLLMFVMWPPFSYQGQQMR
jgi:hypothetical protein